MMTRINLLVPKALLSVICAVVFSSTCVWAEEMQIDVTAYTLTECYHNKGVTASGEMVRPGIIAVSRDLEKKGMKIGTRVRIGALGTFVVKDRTHWRNRGNIDIYMTSYKEALKFGRRKYTFVVEGEKPQLPSDAGDKLVYLLN
mgnify:CR=1 FL=1|jgi:3D (Asp-Asp-Asp) domain-containing protein